MTNSKRRPNHPVGCNAITGQGSASYLYPDVSQQTTSRLLGFVQRSKAYNDHPYLSPDAQQQTTSRSLCYVQRSIPYNDQYRTCLPTPNSDGRPDHSVGCNDHYPTRISAVTISGRKTANHVPTTRVHTNKPRPDHLLPYNGHCRTMISIVPISRCPTANQVPTMRLRSMTISVQGSVPYQSPDAKQQTTS